MIWKHPYRKHMYGVTNVNQAPPPAKVMIVSFSMYIIVSFVTSIAYAVALKLFQVSGDAFGYDGKSFVNACCFTMLLMAGVTLPFTVGKMVWQFKNWIVFGVDASYEVIHYFVMLLLFWYWV